jgi:DNA-directed RNA polymerase specialized sigma24 family protein
LAAVAGLVADLFRRQNMSEAFTDRQRRRSVKRAIRRMQPFDRSILLAIRFEDASYEELAERHGVGVKDVEDAFARAIDALITTPYPRWWQFWL